MKKMKLVLTLKRSQKLRERQIINWQLVVIDMMQSMSEEKEILIRTILMSMSSGYSIIV